MKRGAIILCGGRSSRMGRDKARLELASGELLLERVVRVISEVVGPRQIICVGAPGQELPELAQGVRVVRDPEPHRGPLLGLAVGLRELAPGVEAAFVSACDVPLLAAPFIARMFELLGEFDAAALHDGARWHPLEAVYRATLLTLVESRLAGEDRSLAGLLESIRTRRVTIDELREVDPELRSLASCNTEEEFQARVEGGIARGC